MVMMPPSDPQMDKLQRAGAQLERQLHPVRYWTFAVIMFALLVIIAVLYLMGANPSHVVPQQNPTIGGSPVPG